MGITESQLIKGNLSVLKRHQAFDQTIMPHHVKLNDDLQIIELEFTDILTSENLQEGTDAGISLNEARGVNSFLIDVSSLESVEDLVDLYELPRQYAESGLSRKIRIALVVPKDNEARNAAQFYDNVCNNRGWVVRPFKKRDTAIAWLTSQSSA